MKFIYRLVFLTAISLIISNNAFAQKRNYSQEADNAFNKYQYNLAVDLYKKAYTKVKKNRIERNRIMYRIAESYRLSGSLENAFKQYQRLERGNYQKDFPIMLVHMGDILRTQKDYAEALKYYNQYKTLEKSDSTIEHRIRSCELSSEWVNSPTRHEVDNFRKFNSHENDWSPAWGNSNRRNIIFITSTRKGTTGKNVDAWTGQSFSDIWYFEKPRSKSAEWPGEWVGPKLLDEGNMVNTHANEGEAVANPRGNVIYYTFCSNERRTEQGCKIYTSSKRGRNWSAPEMVQLGPDSFDYVHPAISEDELTMYFASNRPGGQGGYDIWVAKRSRKSRPFEIIENLGSEINTFSHEMFPTLRGDSMLYFSSKGHPGLGGFDIFSTKILEDNRYTPPVNLQYPINSEGDDMGIIFDDTPLLDPISNSEYIEKGFFSSNRKGGRGGDDIYYFKLRPLIFTLSGIVRDSVTMQLLTDVDVMITGSDGSSYSTKTDNKGYYYFGKDKIVHNVTYNISVKKQGYYEDQNTKGMETTVGLTENKDLKHNFRLVPIPKEPILLPDILYELGDWKLLPQYQDSLADLYKIMVDNPTFVIELRSHTDIRPIPMTNDTLSQRRAQSCVDYLIEKGIHPARLVAKGYGEKVPRELTATTYSRHGGQNYKFDKGVTLTPEYINTLQGRNNQEAAHSLNRRTEFRILRDDFVPPASTDEIDKTAIVEFVAEPGKITLTAVIDEDFVKSSCIVNNRQMEFSIENSSSQVFFSMDEAMKLLREGRATTSNFEMKEEAFNEDGTIKEKSIMTIENIRLGDEVREDVEVMVVSGLKTPIVLGDNYITREFGSFDIDKENKKLIINKN
ncbi:MAG: OmpA family protein [Bacteroidales bacterium]|jgi:peptidoglycan-associated lipoprotein|nr:OmpA family protein [Bacteroidales bacterium]